MMVWGDYIIILVHKGTGVFLQLSLLCVQYMMVLLISCSLLRFYSDVHEAMTKL